MEDKLRQIRLCKLSILQEIVRICDKNHIDYWLAYGTMLGAVRHQGFIPWDDDLDIYMTMKGFRKFRRCCKAELNRDYFLQTPDSDPTMGWFFLKVRKNGTQMHEVGQTLENCYLHCGIWVDIFTLINISNASNIRKLQYAILKKLQYYRGLHPYVSNKYTLKNILKSIFSKTLRLYEKTLWGVVLVLGGKKSESLMVMESQFYAHVMDSKDSKKIFRRDWFSNYKNYLFESYWFKGVSDYDAYLTKCYSKDYMTPKRYNAHVEDYSKVII